MLKTALLAVLGPNPTSGGNSGNGRDGGGGRGVEGAGVGDAGAEAAAPAAAAVGSGTVVELNVMCGGASCLASMSIALGCKGLIIVTRLQ